MRHAVEQTAGGLLADVSHDEVHFAVRPAVPGEASQHAVSFYDLLSLSRRRWEEELAAADSGREEGPPLALSGLSFAARFVVTVCRAALAAARPAGCGLDPARAPAPCRPAYSAAETTRR